MLCRGLQGFWILLGQFRNLLSSIQVWSPGTEISCLRKETQAKRRQKDNSVVNISTKKIFSKRPRRSHILDKCFFGCPLAWMQWVWLIVYTIQIMTVGLNGYIKWLGKQRFVYCANTTSEFQMLCIKRAKEMLTHHKKFQENWWCVPITHLTSQLKIWWPHSQGT